MDTQDFLKWLKKEGLYQKAENSKTQIKKVFLNSLDVRNEKILIITDNGMQKRRIAPILAAAYYMVAKEWGLDAHLIAQSAKIKGEKVDPEVDDALTNLEKESIIIMPVSNTLGETEKIGKSFRGFMRKKCHRFVTAPSLGAVETSKLRFVLNCIDIDYRELHKKQMVVKRILDKAKEIHVTSPSGSDFHINVNGVTSISNDGNYTIPCSGGNLPTGEVYLPPAKNGVNGTIVIDMSSRNMLGTTLLKDTIKLKVEKSNVAEIEGGKGARFLDESLSLAEQKAKYPHRIRKIGEFGIGFNPNAKIIGAMIVDEKALGTAHVAVGSNYWFGGDIRTIVHYDQVFRKPKIKIDGKLLII